MRLKSLDVILLGHRKVDPPMQRTYALIRAEAEGGLVGYGEASSNYGHSYPTVIKTIIEDVVARNLIGKDALDIRRRVAEMHVLLDGYLGWEGVTSQVIGGIEIALWGLLGKHAGLPICRLLGAAPTTLPVYGTGTTMFEATPEWHGECYDACLAPNFRTLSPEGKPVVQSDHFRQRDVEAICAAAMEGPLPRLAVEVSADDVILLEDQWFYSAAGSGTPSPWHQDHPYHPLEPWFLTIWVPLDPVPGPVGIRAVAGSHRGHVYAPVEFSAGKATVDAGDIVLRPVPDIDGDPRTFEVHVPDTEPGDAILLDSRTLHAAGGFCHATFRRLSIRYARPDTRFRIRPWPVAAFWSEHDTEDGGMLPRDAFPLISPR